MLMASSTFGAASINFLPQHVWRRSQLALQLSAVWIGCRAIGAAHTTAAAHLALEHNNHSFLHAASFNLAGTSTCKSSSQLFGQPRAFFSVFSQSFFALLWAVGTTSSVGITPPSPHSSISHYYSHIINLHTHTHTAHTHTKSIHPRTLISISPAFTTPPCHTCYNHHHTSNALHTASVCPACHSYPYLVGNPGGTTRGTWAAPWRLARFNPSLEVWFWSWFRPLV